MMDPRQTRLKTDYDRYNWLPPEGAEMLPGFVEGKDPVTGGGGVTYESHTFWVVFNRRVKTRPEAVIYVKHGGGVESLEVRHMIAGPLRALIDAGDLRAAFKLCWGVHEIARYASLDGAEQASQRLKTAFVEGRLKKRKMPGQDRHKVWVEDKSHTV